MFQPSDAAQPAQSMGTPTTENVVDLPPQMPPTMTQPSMFYIETTNTYLTQAAAPILTTGIYTHATTYPYQSMHTQTLTRNSIITPLLTTPNPIVSPPEPCYEVLNLSNVGDVDSDHEREIAPIKTRKMEDGTVKLWNVGVFSQVTDAFCFTMDVSNPKAPSIPMEFRARFERILCNAYRKCTPTAGGVLKARQEDHWVYAIMVTGTRQQALDHIITGLGDIRAHARLRRLRILSFARLGSGKFKCHWDQMDFLFHFFYQDSVILHVHNC